MSIDFSNDDFKKNIHQFYKKVSQELKSKFDRNLSFQDAVFDRWERAKELDFGINTSIYKKSMEKMKIFISIDTPNIHTINITSIKSQN